MGWKGIAIGGSLGSLFGGPLGAILGAALGHKVEERMSGGGGSSRTSTRVMVMSPNAVKSWTFLLLRLATRSGSTMSLMRPFTPWRPM